MLCVSPHSPAWVTGERDKNNELVTGQVAQGSNLGQGEGQGQDGDSTWKTLNLCGQNPIRHPTWWALHNTV